MLPDEPLKRCTIKIERCYYRFLDYDNSVSSLKPVVDGLIHSSVISDDSYKITGPWHIRQSFRPKKEGSLLKVDIYERPYKL